MGICTDKSNDYLRDVGYNVVRLPRDFLPPLSLLARQDGRRVEYIGSLDRLITNPAGQLPAITSDRQAATINGKSTSSMELKLGLSILSGLISGLGGGKLGASASYTDATSVSFEFNNVTFDAVSAIEVGGYLRNGEIDADNPLIEQYVLGNGNLYVVTERLRSSEITTLFETKSGAAANVDVPVIAQQIGGNLEVERSSGRNNGVKLTRRRLRPRFHLRSLRTDWTTNRPPRRKHAQEHCRIFRWDWPRRRRPRGAAPQ